jgi:hypothetical protein
MTLIDYCALPGPTTQLRLLKTPDSRDLRSPKTPDSRSRDLRSPKTLSRLPAF